MKYYELHAIKPGAELVERFFEDGRRFLKYVPFNPKIIATLQEQFKNKPVNVELKGTWIVITKTGKIDDFEKAAKTLMKDGEELTVEKLAREEQKMLQKAGFTVTYMVGDIK